ncbi:MAG: hypothetical protein NG784_14700 [Candidatus Jettenia sp.]|nr:hypothetical protein [Candidatus Jettenia sp.]
MGSIYKIDPVRKRHWIPDKLVLVKTGKHSGMTNVKQGNERKHMGMAKTLGDGTLHGQIIPVQDIPR